MRAQLKEIYSIQIPEKLINFWPAEPTDFGILLRLMIGPEGVEHSDSFEIFVCTPTWIKNRIYEDKYMWGQHLLIVQEYDYELFRQTLSKNVSLCTGKDWHEVARKISRFAAWEFEDYQPLR